MKGLKEQDSALALRQVTNMLGYLWIDNTEQEAYQTWRRYVEMNPSKGAEILDYFEQVLAAPPPDLNEILEKNWIILYHTEGSQQVPYSYREQLEWLTRLAGKLKTIYNEVTASQ